MDIAKYIGLFLLKNHYCYIHGLGNLELVKRAATYDGTALQPAVYDVIVTPGGSIDDNLANFIATNEQISISKAANTLREYSIQTRKEIANGNPVPIPHIGNFIEQDGKVKFVTDANFLFKPAGIPTIRNSKQLEEQNSRLSNKPSYPEPQKADSVNWSMVILVVVLLLILGGGGYGIYYYMHANKAAAPVAVTPAPAKDSMQQSVFAADTANHKKDSVASAVPLSTIDTYKMIVGDYPTKAKAETRIRNLKANGHTAEIAPKDSAGYYIYTTITCSPADTTHIKDSLQTLFGYRNVMIYN